MNLVNSEPRDAFITRCHARVRRSPPAMAEFLFRQAPGECLQRHSDYLFLRSTSTHLRHNLKSRAAATRLAASSSRSSGFSGLICGGEVNMLPNEIILILFYDILAYFPVAENLNIEADVLLVPERADEDAECRKTDKYN